MSNLRLAWRNIWRNKRRTILTAASIFLAVFLAVLVRSIQVGWFDYLIEVTIRSYTGHIQLHQKGYWNDRDINHSMVFDQNLEKVIETTGNVDQSVPRLEYFALSSFQNQTKGVLLVGTDPIRENEMTRLSAKVVKGDYLSKSGNGLMVAEGLADFLEIAVGDTLVLIGQGYHGVGAAGRFPVCGIVRFASPQLNNQMVYMNLAACQEYYDAGNRITSLSLTLKNPDEMDITLQSIRAMAETSQCEVMRWDEMMAELMQTLNVKTAGGMIIVAILYMIVGFGIFGTVIMMTNERLREFSVMVSVGMQKSRLAIILVAEMVMIGLIGAIAGVLAALPIMIWYSIHPIHLWGQMADAFVNFGIEPVMPLAFKMGFVVSNFEVVLLIVLFTSIYPVRKIFKLKVAASLHQ